MKVKTHRHLTHTITLDDDREFETTHEVVDTDSVIVKDVPDGRTVIGYLSHDHDPENPLESCDAMGKILDRRGRNRDVEREALEAMGIDEYGEKVGTPDPFAVLLDVYSHSGDVWRVHGGGRYFCDEQWDVSNGAGVWLPDKYCREHILSMAAKDIYNVATTEKCLTRALPNGTKEYYTLHGYVLPDGRKRSGYETTEKAIAGGLRALKLKPDKALKERYDDRAREEAVKCAGQAVEVYNQWCSGDVYGVVVETYDKDGAQIDEESCWGFFGDDHAGEELASNVEATWKALCAETNE
jgi:hypothetical protein